MVNPIYTRKGDKGKTGLLTGERVEKIDPRIEAYGTVDELIASLYVIDYMDVPLNAVKMPLRLYHRRTPMALSGLSGLQPSLYLHLSYVIKAHNGRLSITIQDNSQGSCALLEIPFRRKGNTV